MGKHNEISEIFGPESDHYGTCNELLSIRHELLQLRNHFQLYLNPHLEIGS